VERAKGKARARDGGTAPSGTPCKIQYGAIAAIYILEAAYRVARWPHTTPIGNIGPLAAALTTALIASSQGFGFNVLSVELAMLVQSYLSMTCAGLKTVIALVDEKLWQKREVKARYQHNDFDWCELDTVVDEKAKALLEKVPMKEGDVVGETRNPLLQLSRRLTRGGAESEEKYDTKPPANAAVSDTSSTLALLLQMKAEAAAVGKKPLRGSAKKRTAQRASLCGQRRG
jgi:hypothetical protein